MAKKKMEKKDEVVEKKPVRKVVKRKKAPEPKPEPVEEPKKRPQRKKKQVTQDLENELKAKMKKENTKVSAPKESAYKSIPKPPIEKGEGISIVFFSEALTKKRFTKTREKELQEWMYHRALEFDVVCQGLWVKEFAIKILVKNRFAGDPVNFEFIGATFEHICRVFNTKPNSITLTIKHGE